MRTKRTIASVKRSCKVKTTKLKSVFILLFVVCLTVTGVAYAIDTGEITQENQVSERVREIEELRELTSKVYELSDGTYEYVGYADDIHYVVENGKLDDIDTSIKDVSKNINGVTYKYQNTANSFDVLFSDVSESEHPVTLKLDDYSVSFGLKNSAKATAEKSISVKIDVLSDMIDEDSSIIYNNVMNGVDILYESVTHGVKEFIILNNKPNTNKFEFIVKTDGLTLNKTKDNKIEFVNAKHESIFRVANLFAVDNNEEITKNVICDFEKVGEDYILSITLDENYLNDNDRAYPVIIDPSVVISSSSTLDSFVASKSPNSNYNSGSNMQYLRTGRDSYYYTRRSYLKFNIPTSIQPDTVTSAYLTMRRSSGLNPTIRAYRVTGNWNSNTVTWNNKPSYVSTDRSGLAYSFTQYGSSSWYKMNVTNIVRDWVNGNNTNYGFLVRDDTESGTSHWTTFYSSDATSPNKPELIINYTASANRYAYSIGINHNGDDFTPNVTYARNKYNSISSINGSYYNTSPTVSYMKGNNANGNRRIASNVVFLNGHANANGLSFDTTGVTRGVDNTERVGLTSTNMNSVELISFVGCSTGAGSTNLSKTAVSRGAKTSLGFTGSIHSRRDDGRAWLRTYNDYLANGYSVNYSVSRASAINPTSTLSTYAIIEGNLYTRITNSSKSSDTHIKAITIDSNIKLDSKDVLSTVEADLKKHDPAFDASKYIATQVDLSDSMSYILYNYYIDETIQTDKAYLIVFEDGLAKEVVSQVRDSKNSTSEADLLSLVENYVVPQVDIDLSDVHEYSERYLYYYSTDTLVHEISIIRASEAEDGSIEYGDETMATIIK